MTSPQICIIAISGQSGSGMTSLAKGLVDKLVRKQVKTSYISCLFLAEAVLERATDKNAWSVKTSDERFSRTIQGEQTSWHEAVLDIDMAIRVGHSDLFPTNALCSKILKLLSSRQAEVVVVDDVRQMEDYLALKELGARFVRLHIPEGRKFIAQESEFASVVQENDMTDVSLDDVEFSLCLRERKTVQEEVDFVMAQLESYLRTRAALL